MQNKITEPISAGLYASFGSLVCFIADRALKWFVTEQDMYSPGWVSIVHIPNSVGVFSLPIPSAILLWLAVPALFVLVAIGWSAWRKYQWVRYWGVGLMIVGGVSNVMDRLFSGSVQDVLWLPVGLSFNLADVYIVLGVLLVVVG